MKEWKNEGRKEGRDGGREEGLIVPCCFGYYQLLLDVSFFLSKVYETLEAVCAKHLSGNVVLII